jgi:outer membrane receptor protein involved in Fe transport
MSRTIRCSTSVSIALGLCTQMFLSVLLAFVISRPAFAQVAGATLSGRVTDPSDAVIPGAQVTIKDVGKGITRITTADTAGIYTAPNLLPGNYDLTCSAPGFATEVRTRITLTVGAQQVLDIAMRVGQASQVVAVTGEAPAVELASSTVSAVINDTTVRDLPLNGRDWTQLATLQPGVSSMGSEQLATNGNPPAGRGNRGFGTQVSISGGRPQQNNYRLDGVSMNDYANSTPGGVLGGALGVDAIAEFSVLTSNYSSEYGRTSGGVINAITRSGSSQFHGDAYEFLRNSALDAANFFDNANGIQKPPFRRNQFGGSAGGPIWKDRTFFFADYEGLRQSLGVTTVDTVPSPNARNGILEFPGGPSTFPSGCNSTNNPSDPNQCQVTVDPLVKPFLRLWAPSNGPILAPGNGAVFSFAGQQVTNENFVTGRIDHKLSQADSLFGSFQWDHAQGHLPDNLNDVLIGQQTARHFGAVEESHTFNPHFINTVRGGFNRSVALAGYGASAINPLAAGPLLSGTPGEDAPQIVVPGLTHFNGGVNALNDSTFHWNSFQGYDDAFLTKGIHSLKFGFAVERDQQNIVQFSNVGGSYNFGSLASFLTNKPKSLGATISSTISGRGLRQSIFGAYVQDDVRWRPNLTVNLGLRYEMSTVPTEANNKLSNVRNPTDAAPTLGGPYFSNPTLRNFEPRVGFAWDPFKDGKTSVRAGFGIFDVLPLTYEYALLVDRVAPFTVAGSATNLAQESFPTLAFADLAAVNQPRLAHVDPQPKRDYVMQWNFNIQRQLEPDLTAMVAYVGSRGVHQLYNAGDMNMVLPKLTPAGYLWPSPVGSGTVLNPNAGELFDLSWSANSFFDALELQIVKKMSHGIQIEGSYTWGKSIDEGSGSAVGDPFNNSVDTSLWFDRSLHRGLSDFNFTHNLVVNFTWIVPTPKSLQGAAGWALGGWQVGSILQARTGLPFTPIVGGDPLGQLSNNTFDYPNRLAGPGCQSAVNPGNINQYINLRCFAFPNPSNLLGNARRNSLVGPGLVNLDFSVFKNNYIKRISESFNMQFRAEFFNVINHANFSSPDDNNTLFDETGAPVSGAGLIDSTSTIAREIQFALKLIW